MFSCKNFSERIIAEALCRISPAQDRCNKDQNYADPVDDGREYLLDDVTELLNEIYTIIERDSQ